MKAQRLHLKHLIRLGLAAGLASWTATAWTATGRADDEFPLVVPFYLGKAHFAPGDNITIESVRGTAAEFKTNETYCVEGVYTLNSADEADLALFVTARQDAPSKIDPRQRVRIKKGSGSFRLVETMAVQGYPHVSFYPLPAGPGGGIYFGMGAWLLPEQIASPSDHAPARGGSAAGAGAKTALSGPNRVLFEYLGEPVAAPANLETAYTKDGLRRAVQSAARQAGIETREIVIDDSEYPCLVGVICREGDFAKLRAQLEKAEAYEYRGDVGGHTRYTFNLTPWRVWPPEAQARIARRLVLRMQVFNDRLQGRE
ncbi:MAG: hypothetical protein ABSF95_06245 [Verrucomicrobiota bacterium]|jgi:hypothetical protein